MAMVLYTILTAANMKVIGRTAYLMAMVFIIILTAANGKVIGKKEFK
jgi:hypothetical protein